MSTNAVSEITNTRVSNVESSGVIQDDIYLDKHIKTAMKQRHTMTKKKKEKDYEIEWPEPIPIELKLKCLKNFIKQMSMSSLAESVCGICNIRCYRRDLHRIPLTKIPCIQLLRVHDDLHKIIVGTHQIQKVHTEVNTKLIDNIAPKILENNKSGG
jgi:hypothetical protein